MFQSGNPLSPSDPNYDIHPGYDVPNFHRIVVHGSTFPLECLRLTIQPGVDAAAASGGTSGAFGPFVWQRVRIRSDLPQFPPLTRACAETRQTSPAAPPAAPKTVMSASEVPPCGRMCARTAPVTPSWRSPVSTPGSATA